jgi:hypothetical protein
MAGRRGQSTAPHCTSQGPFWSNSVQQHMPETDLACGVAGSNVGEAVVVMAGHRQVGELLLVTGRRFSWND